MNRPNLNEIPLSDVLPLRRPELIVTMSEGQWDKLLEISYERGWILLEVNDDEQPIKAYRRKVS
ncbi:hypothetical protein L0244_19960 [bacterium]|nr:hypothetical protein [bacterium]